MDKYKSAVVSAEDIMHLLEMSGWAKVLNHQQLEYLASYFHPYVFAKGVKILEEGKRNAIFGVVAKGAAVVVKNDRLEKAKSIATIGPGKIFGEISFFDEDRCSADVIASEEMTALIMEE